ncbi:hypothetical protein [Caulobacter sp. S45]|uniref:hypothetical protein n=1 Tax=Caulobacter sp. S45 TaxID=1641861 RepID=UPI00157709A9|nr:hypothetical protein [Caulobacter sp. S45]
MQSAFGAGFLWGTPVNGAPVMFAALQSCSMDVSFDQKTMYGQSAFALEMARGKGKIDFKAAVGRIDPVLFNAIFWNQGLSSGQVRTAVAEPATPSEAGGVGTYVAVNGAAFRVDLGVYDSAHGRFLTRLGSGTPAEGQYTVNPANGAYTFSSADIAPNLKVYYTYGSASTGSTISVSNPVMDAGPVFRADLVQSFRGRQSVLTAWACQSFKLSMPLKQDDFTLPEISFSALDDGTGAVLSHAVDAA